MRCIINLINQNNILELAITSVAFGGAGIARHSGKVYFVSDAVEGDIVKAQIYNSKKKYSDAIIKEFIKKSPFRTPTNPCPYSSECGGCIWLDIDYEKQLQWKKGFVSSALKRIGKLQDDIELSIIPSPKILHYRNRVLLRAFIDESGKINVGYFKKSTRTFIKIDKCKIAEQEINDFISSITSINFQDIPPQKFRLEISLADDNQKRGILVTIYPAEKQWKNLDLLAKKINDNVLWAGLVFDLNKTGMFKFCKFMDLDFYTKPGQFQQINFDLNHKLQQHVYNLALSVKPKRVLDLFCGSANLSLSLASKDIYVEGIETNKHAIEVAKYNAQINGVPNTNYLSGEAERHLWKCFKKGESFDLIIADPPREGMYKELIPLGNPKHIIYISCNPSTLARDIGALKNYNIKKINTFDLFPNTFHVETVCLLERNGPTPT